jgi:hypothetical protein
MTSSKRDLTIGFLGLGRHYGDDISPFDQLFNNKVNLLAGGDQFKKCQAIVIWGGTDIHPSIYGHKAHRKSQVYNDREPSHRDQMEWHAMREAKKAGCLIIGVCRGAQMLCAFAGGSLYQDVSGHESGHQLKSYDGRIMFAQAMHHQMMNLDNTKYDLLAWPESPHPTNATTSRTALSRYYEREDYGQSQPGAHLLTGVEPEIVWFPEVNGFAVQAHPEWGNPQGEFQKFCLEEINKRIK